MVARLRGAAFHEMPSKEALVGEAGAPSTQGGLETQMWASALGGFLLHALLASAAVPTPHQSCESPAIPWWRAASVSASWQRMAAFCLQFLAHGHTGTASLSVNFLELLSQSTTNLVT